MDNKKLAEIQKKLDHKITLIAVSKTHSKAEIDEAYALGCRIFGENKVQELKAKYDDRYTWHMLGHLQRNKVKDVVHLVAMIQSLDSLRLAEEIHKQCKKIDKIMPVLVEVNISREVNKTGVMFEECLSFVKQCEQFSHIEVQGIMCVGPSQNDHDKTDECFEKMHVLYHKLQVEYGLEKIKYLSMGMSGDYELAMKHGSNMIRLGTIIFGERDYT